ncbi:MAG: carbon storage regulator [Fuerstiella sp.]
MLVLTRKQGEEILIDDRIQVKIIHCANGRTRIGIVAPREIEISRPDANQRNQLVEGTRKTL